MKTTLDSTASEGASPSPVDVASPAREPRSPLGKDAFLIERDGVRFAGTHLMIDLFEAQRLDDLEYVEDTLRQCAEAAGATLLHAHFHHFAPHRGVTGVALLSESHISIHSWPEYGYAALDIFTCGRATPREAIPILERAFRPRRLVVHEHLRGKELDL